MFQYKKYFDEYCEENKLSLSLSYTMPCGYETAFGTFDLNLQTIFINKNLLKDKNLILQKCANPHIIYMLSLDNI